MADVCAWIFGIGAMAALFGIYQQTSGKRLLLCKLCADVCWMVHYVCLGAYSGAVPGFVGIFREVIFMNRGIKKWAAIPVWPVLFVSVNLILGLRTFRMPMDLLPIVTSAVVTIALWLRKPMLTKLISAPASVAFLIYDIYVGSWIGVVSESISLASLLIFLVKIGLKKN